jgi:predicted nucleotidyltransferase
MIKLRKLPDNIRENISALNDLFNRNPNIIFAYLFGGLLRERPSSLSDVDIAVYLNDPKKLDFLQLFHEMTSILGTEELDLVILNDAAVSLSGRILLNRKILVDKKPFVRHKYESLTMRKYFDFRVRESQLVMRRYGIG